MVLSTEWSQVEVIDLVNDGSGLGFGIVGGKSTGVVIKSILPGGIADKDNRLQSGDHILQIGDVNLRGLGSEQVATVLRQAGSQVRMVVARPFEPTSSDFQNIGSTAPIVPTKILTDPEELDRQLLQNGYTEIYNLRQSSFENESQTEVDEFDYSENNVITPSINDSANLTKNLACVINFENSCKDILNSKSAINSTNVNSINAVNSTNGVNSTIAVNSTNIAYSTSTVNTIKTTISVNSTSNLNSITSINSTNDTLNFTDQPHNLTNPAENLDSLCNTANTFKSIDVNVINVVNINNSDAVSPDSFKHILLSPIDIDLALPETKRFAVELNKNEFGLGITVAGYVCEREDLCGIFIKSVSEGSDAHKCGLIEINDRIIEVNGLSLQNLTNHEAVEKLKQAGDKVVLTLERYLRGPKYESLQEALACQEVKDLSPPSPSVTTLSWIPIDAEAQIEPEGESIISVNSEIYENNPETKEIFIEENFEADLTDSSSEETVKKKWEGILGQGTDIIVAQLTKLKGLGISLEGTVDVEDGVELRPHHYIRSILPEGPVGQNGKLSSGDELLEVNGQKLLGINHVEVVKILKELPNTVRLVCARKEENRVINTSQDREAFEQRNILGGSLKNLLPQPEQRLLKAVSDTSINTSSTATITDENGLQKVKSRSLEVTNLAMWSDDIEYVELKKGDRGLGFSILDYQDPLDLNSTVIVIRSLVPNGPAEADGRLTPGDRLISVNDKIIKNATLDQAVQALKGTLPGIVKIGLSKPLPSSRQSDSHSSHTVGS